MRDWETRVLVSFKRIFTRTKVNGGKGSLNTNILVFDGKNWNQWMIQMCVLFGAQYVLDLVNDSYAAVAADATEAQRNI